MSNVFISRANRINERFADVYRDAFKEIVEVAKERGIVKIVFSLHNEIGIDVPNIVFERERFDEVSGKMSSEYSYEALSEIVFNESYSCITLIGSGLSYAYMDEYWGDYFDVMKLGQIFQAFMEIVGNEDIKEIELA